MVMAVLVYLPAQEVTGGQSTNGDLKSYERKSLFIFPILINNNISSSLINDARKDFLLHQMFKMFVLDFRRIDSFNVSSDDSIDAFLQDTHSYIEKNVKDITLKRLEPDGKLKEAVLTSDSLIKTTEDSFVLVPFLDFVEREVVQGDKTASYIYNMYVHFDIYKTKTKEKIKTLRINNKKNWIGALASFTGSLQVDNSDLYGLPEEEKKDEESFRDSIAGLFTVLKKQLKEIPEFCITAELSMVKRSKFGFDMGNDTGIKIDERYKTYVKHADGRKKMTGFGKIRTVKGSYSEAQILIGKPTEGDQVIEDPKIGINAIGAYGIMPLQIAMPLDGIYAIDIVGGTHKCLFFGLEYEMGPTLGWSEYYTALNLRIGAPAPTSFWGNYYTVSQVIINLGVVKKMYLKRLALNLGGFFGVHNAAITDSYSNETSGTSIGFTANAGLEFMVTPSLSAFGAFTLDYYPNPATLEYNNNEEDFPDGWQWNSIGLSMNFGVKVTF